MSQQVSRFVKDMRNQAKKDNADPVQVGEVISLQPFTIAYQGLELSKENGDKIYVNNLLLDENINLDLGSMDSPQNIDPALWKGDNVPTSTVSISGTQKQFITDFYNWVKAVHNRFIIHIGDFVAIQKLGNNTYIVLEKVQEIEQ